DGHRFSPATCCATYSLRKTGGSARRRAGQAFAPPGPMKSLTSGMSCQQKSRSTERDDEPQRSETQDTAARFADASDPGFEKDRSPPDYQEGWPGCYPVIYCRPMGARAVARAVNLVGELNASWGIG